MLRILIMTFSLIAVVAVNVAANIIPFNGKTTGEIANRLPVLFTPASYVFIIWAVIFMLLAVWIYVHSRRGESTDLYLNNWRAALFVFSCLLNISWILLWHYTFFNWTIVVMFVLLLTLFALYSTYPKQESRQFERLPISIYLGWIFVATIANGNYVLTFHEWNGWGLSNPLWTVISLSVATAIALHFLYHYKDRALNVVFMWAFIGIAVKNGVDELFVSSAALFLTAVIGVSLFVLKKPH
ncbi:tryptophan-rich sensory protein [Filibacter tadaridae]|uniref:TspO/MBR family protein n=1 Tax=Filibacter tadaridae TaxID=2483811 RepID=A0A3P5WVZ3_9BACL|nr:tryptophan-rich sensory protein [Filibacter tadaridae]VDC22666.1 hypothetical protein FILTAD_00833 [Filibacter tadaridae]